MDENQLNAKALTLCMRSGLRYIECQHIVAFAHIEILDVCVWNDVQNAFNVYVKKMKEAGLPVRVDLFDL